MAFEWSKSHIYLLLCLPFLCLTHSQADAFLHCGIAPLWCCYMSTAWLCFYQLLGPFKWMIPVLRRDHRTKKPSLSSDPVPLLFLPCLSLKAQLQSFVTPPRLFFFHPDSLQGQSLFGSTHLGRQPWGVVTSSLLFFEKVQQKVHRIAPILFITWSSLCSPSQANALYNIVNLFTFWLELCCVWARVFILYRTETPTQYIFPAVAQEYEW